MGAVLVSNDLRIDFVVLVELQDGTRHWGRRRVQRTLVPAPSQWEWHQWVIHPLRISHVEQDQDGVFQARLVTMENQEVLRIDQFSEMLGDWSWTPAEAYGPKLHTPSTEGRL